MCASISAAGPAPICTRNARRARPRPPSAATNAATPSVAYIYIAGQGVINDPRNVLMYEPPENHAGEGANVLFADGHVQFIRPYSEVERLVAETKARIAQRPAPK